MNRGFTMAIVRALFIVATLIFTTESVNAQENKKGNEAPPAGNIDDVLMQKLQETVGDFDYDREDFERIIDDLRERFDLNIHVSWRAIEPAGIKPDERVSITLKQVPLTTFLDFLLLETMDNNLDAVSYFVSNGVLMLSTEQSTKPPTVLRTYDVTDLIESGYSIRRFANTPVLSLRVTGREYFGGEKTRKSGGGYGGGGGSIFGDPDEEPQRIRRMGRIQASVNLIMQQIDPDTWMSLGGSLGNITIVNNTLFIQHTVQAHLKIVQLLEMVRRTKPTAVDVDAILVRARPEDIDRWREDSGDSFPRLDDATATKLFDDSTAVSTLFRGTSSGFNGRRVWFSAVAQRDVLSGLIPIVGSNVNAFGTARGVVTDGLELVVLPLLLSDSEQAEVDVQFAWIPPTVVTERSFTPASGAEQTSVDVTKRRMRTVSCTVQVRIGQAIALTIAEEPGAGDEYEEWLIVRVRQSR